MNRKEGLLLLDTLKKIRSDTNLSVEETAKRIGISKGYYSMIENGQRGLSYSMAKRIAAVFNLKPDDIFLQK